MKNIKFKMPAFSLAEALITLLIVCLITLASIPVLTKKKRTITSSPHGTWICTLNSSGQHVVWSTSSDTGDKNNPDTWQPVGNSCKFIPPANARNFAISAAAGGGGGASASDEQKMWSGTREFALEVPGIYNMIAIGGGGVGGGSSDSEDRSVSGNAGGVAALKILLDERVSSIKMTQGAKGTGTSGDDKVDGTKHTGHQGGSSLIKLVYRNDNGISQAEDLIWAEGGLGGHGGEHGGSDADRKPRALAGVSISSLANKFTVVDKICFGKTTSGSICYPILSTPSSCGKDTEMCANTMIGAKLEKGTYYNAKRCNAGHMAKRQQAAFNKFFKDEQITLYPEVDCTEHSFLKSGQNTSTLSVKNREIYNGFCNMPGMGGGSKPSVFCGNTSGEGEGAHAGTNGLVQISTIYYSSGRGGYAGESVSNVFYPSLNSKYLNVSIGHGGVAGVTTAGSNGRYSAVNGGNGGDTVVKNDKNEVVVGLTGGNGGTGLYLKQALIDTAGGNGNTTTLFYSNKPVRGLGGFSYADPANKSGTYNSGKDAIQSKGYGDGGGGGAYSHTEGAGNGAAGANGVVMIQW